MASSSVAETVDDRDLRLEYSGNWILGGGSSEYQSTTHGTYEAGSQAKFTFKGSSVAVYGTISDNQGGRPLFNAPVTTYSIDGSPIHTFSPPLPHGNIYRQLFYQASNLDDNQHVLVMTSTVTNASFWLDYLQITSNAQIPSPVNTQSESTQTQITQLPSSSSPPPSSQSTLQSTLPTSVLGTTSTSVSSILSPPPQSIASSTQGGGSPNFESPSQTSAVSSTTFTTKTTPKGAIAGGVIGGIVLIFIIGLLIWLYRREVKAQRVVSEDTEIQAESSNNMNSRWTRPPPILRDISSHIAVSPFTGQHPQYTTGGGGPREKNTIDFALRAEAPLDPSDLSSGYTTGSASLRDKTISHLTGSSVPAGSLNPFAHTPSSSHDWGRNERTEEPNNREVFPPGEILTPVRVTNRQTHSDVPPAYEPRRS